MGGRADGRVSGLVGGGARRWADMQEGGQSGIRRAGGQGWDGQAGRQSGMGWTGRWSVRDGHAGGRAVRDGMDRQAGGQGWTVGRRAVGDGQQAGRWSGMDSR